MLASSAARGWLGLPGLISKGNENALLDLGRLL